MVTSTNDKLKQAAISGGLFLLVSLPQVYKITDGLTKQTTVISFQSAAVQAVVFALLIFALLYFGEKKPPPP